MSTFYLLRFCQLHLGPLILKDRKQLEPRDPFFMKAVLKAKKETLDTTPLLCKIKAKAVFEGQETGGERHLQPENSPGGSSTLRTFGRALHGETVCTTMTSSNSPPMATGWRRLRQPPTAFVENQDFRANQYPKSLKVSAQDMVKVSTASRPGREDAAVRAPRMACFALCQAYRRHPH